MPSRALTATVTWAMRGAMRASLVVVLLAVWSCTWTHSRSTPQAAETARTENAHGETVIERGAAYHRVAAGETVYRVARRYGVDMDRLIADNGLAEPFLLQIGQRLALPPAGSHTVAAGETLFGIAQDRGVTVAAMAAYNGIGPPYTIRVGQRLSIPPRVGAPAAVPASAVAASARGELPPPPLPEAAFIWPVDGRVVSTFGPKADGRRNDGVNIAAPRGAPVRAAQSGVVAYADNTIRGLGNLILVKHQGGVVTAYAHTETRLVARGDVVARGQVIARVGSTGNVATPQLHFQIRRGGTPVDPVPILDR